MTLSKIHLLPTPPTHAATSIFNTVAIDTRYQPLCAEIFNCFFTSQWQSHVLQSVSVTSWPPACLWRWRWPPQRHVKFLAQVSQSVMDFWDLQTYFQLFELIKCGKLHLQLKKIFKRDKTNKKYSLKLCES